MTKFEEEAERFSLYLEQLGYRKVIPCPDCEHVKDMGEWYRCSLLGIHTTAIDYCSRAKRKKK